MKTTNITAIETEKFLVMIDEMDVVKIQNKKNKTEYFTTLEHLCELMKMEELNN